MKLDTKEFEEKMANGEIKEENAVDPLDQVNDFLPNENGLATAPEDAEETKEDNPSEEL